MVSARLISTSGRALVLLVLLLLAVRSAAEPADRATSLYREAQMHYNLGQYQLAIEKLTAAVQIDPALAGAYRNLGLAYVAVGKCELALPHFRRYLALRGSGKHAERVRVEIAACLRKLGLSSSASPPLGDAHLVVAVPAGPAQIAVDGVPMGSTPGQAFPMTAGRHTVRVRKAGYRPWSREVVLGPGQVLAIEARLEPDPAARDAARADRPGVPAALAALRLRGLPRGAVVRVDGERVRLDAEGTAQVPSGEHRIEVSRWGMQPWQVQAALTPGRLLVLSPSLEATARSRSLRRWGWMTLALGAVLGGAGAVVGLVENRSFEEIRDYDRQRGSRAALNARIDSQRAQAITAYVLYGLAGAAAATGLVLLTITPELRGRGAVVSAGMAY